MFLFVFSFLLILIFLFFLFVLILFLFFILVFLQSLHLLNGGHLFLLFVVVAIVQSEAVLVAALVGGGLAAIWMFGQDIPGRKC